MNKLKKVEPSKTLKPLNKKGQLGLDIVRNFILVILTVAVIGFAAVVALSSLNNSNALTAGTLESNLTTELLQNVTEGTADFFSNSGTWFSLLSVVIIIAIVVVVIFFVNRLGRGGGGRV